MPWVSRRAVSANPAVMSFGDTPVTAAELAFYFDEFDDLPLATVNSKLKRLMKKGLVAQDGDRYRYVPPSRPPTPDQERKSHEIGRAFDKLRPSLESFIRRRDN